MGFENDQEFTIQRIAVRDLKPGENIRKAVSEEEIAALATSLKKKQWQPIVVSPDKTILDGWRRYLAALKAEIAELWAIVTERALSGPERITAQLIMGLHRKDFTEQEKVLACEELMEASPGLDQKQLATKLNVDPTTVCRWMSVSLDRVTPEVRRCFLDGSIKLMHTYPLSQLPKDQHAELLAFALRGATRAQIETEVRRRKQPSNPIQLSRVRCMLPGGTAINVTGEEMSVDTVIEHLTVLLNEFKRGRGQGIDIKTMQLVLADKAKAANAEKHEMSSCGPRRKG